MRILIFGAGVLGCNMAHNFYKAGKDVTLLARGKWAESIKEKGLVIKNKFSLKPSCDHIAVIEELKKEDAYDVIFICLRYTQLPSIMETIKNNVSKNIVFIGNNMNAEKIAKELEEKNVMFGFSSSAGHRETNRVMSVDLKKVTIGDLKTGNSHEDFIKEIFRGTKYRVFYESNMGDYLISHAAYVIPMAFACYYTDGDLKKIKNDKSFTLKVINACAECYEAVEKLGHCLLPKGEEEYRTPKYRKTMYRFCKLIFSTNLGKICVSDHAMNATDEMGGLAEELVKMIQEAGIEANNFFELYTYLKK